MSRAKKKPTPRKRDLEAPAPATDTTEEHRPPSEEELNAAAAKRDAAKAFETVFVMEDNTDALDNLIAALQLIAGGLDGREQAALHGLANGLEDALDSLKEQRAEVFHLLWGYGPGAFRVKDAAP